MDGWASISACAAPYYRCLGYYARSDIPNLATLADHFTVSNRTFSMTNSPSWGGHLYAAAATLDGFIGGNSYPAKGVAAGPGWGCDSNKLAGWRAPNGSVMTVPSCIPAADGSGPFRPSPVRHVPTIFDRLSGAGYSWKIYGQTKVNTTAGTPYGWSICPSFADCLYTRQVHRLVPSVDVLTDAARGHLPAYSVVTPSLSSSRLIGTSTSQHNGSSMKAGDNWIGKVVSAIEKGPNWRSTAIFITYDDCGCFYDHVSPPRNPDGSREGIRVPMVIVSPYAKRGGLDSNNATFASILAYTEHNFGLKPLAANDRNAYNYAKAFNYNQTPLKGVALKTRPIPRSSLQYLRTHPSPDDDDT
jgi:phospholipase C